MKKRSRINSDRNCSHCLYAKGKMKAVDESLVTLNCPKTDSYGVIQYHGTTCEDFWEDPNNPVPRQILSEEEKGARQYLRKKRRERGDRIRQSIKAYQSPGIYPKLKIKAPLIKSKKKQKRVLQILSDNQQVTSLLDILFKLPKRSSSEGRKVRRQLRKLGYYLSRKDEPLNIKRPKPPSYEKRGRKKEGIIIDLNVGRKKEFQRAGIIDIDPVLLRECAYYPRPKGTNTPSACTLCSFKKPNEDCKRSHILIDTRIKKRG